MPISKLKVMERMSKTSLITGCVLSSFFALRFWAAAQSPIDYLSETQSLLVQGRIPEAEKAINAYLRLHSESTDGHDLRAEILFREKKAKESLAEFTEGARGRRPTARDFGMIASDYVLIGDYADADRWFTEATVEDPHEAKYWYLLGRTKYKESDYTAAVKLFDRALLLNPRYIEAENNRGLALSALQQKDAAIEAFQSAIDWQGSTGTDAQPYFNLGSMLIEQNDLVRGIALLNKSVQLFPTNPRMHEQLGKAFAEHGDFSLAQNELEKAITLSPDISSLHFMLGQVYKKQKMDDLAKREFAICARLIGTHSSAITPNPFGPEIPEIK